MGLAEGGWGDLFRLPGELEDGEVGGLAERLRWRFDEALVAGPECYAVVLAAADWREAAGIPIPVERLYSQAVRRMAALVAGRTLTREEFARGLAWAADDPALLSADQAGHYELVGVVRPPLLLERLPGTGVAEALAGVTPLEAVAIGKAAWLARDGDRKLANSAWDHAAVGDDADAAALAEWYRAQVARDDGDVAAAKAAFARIVRQDHFVVAPQAMLALARLEFDTAPETAEGLLHRAVAAGHRLVAAPAARLLRDLRVLRGDEIGAVAAARIAFDHHDLLLAAHDGLALAALLVRCGDASAAEQVLREVIALDDPLSTAQAVGNLARVLAARRDLAGAEQLLIRAIPEEHLFRADLQIALAGVHLALEDLRSAEALLAEAKAHPVPPQLPPQPFELARAEMMEAQIAVVRGDDPAAERLFTGVFEHENVQIRLAAHELALQLGEQLRLTGPCAIPGTMPLLRHLMVEAGTPLREWAAYGVGRIAEATGDLRQARHAYQLAVAGGNPRYGTLAASKLANTTVSATEQDEALHTLMGIIEGESAEGVAEAIIPAGTFAWHCEHLDLIERVRLIVRIHEASMRHAELGGPHAARVAFALGVLNADVLGSPGTAIPAWEIAVGSDDPEIAPAAAYNLGLAHTHTSSPISAAHSFERAIASGHSDFAPRAMLALGLLAEDLTDLDTAAHAYLRALISEHPRASVHAAFQLACLIHQDQPEDAEIALHQVIASSTAPAALIGAAYAQLGRIYAANGNRVLAQRYWRKGRRHTDRHVSAAYATERKRIGRVTRPRRPPHGQ